MIYRELISLKSNYIIVLSVFENYIVYTSELDVQTTQGFREKTKTKITTPIFLFQVC